MCYSPIQIVNPTKYVSLQYRDRYLLDVPCGKCAQCKTNKRNEYYFRSFYQALQVFENQGFVLFDTLTYDDRYLPHIDDYLSQLQLSCADRFHYPCFDSRHIRLFIKNLRQHVKRKLGVNFTYFLSSEYGTSDYYKLNGRLRRATHRPHYHVLFFVDGHCNPLDFSKLISECWCYGRTDGYPYRSASYVLGNTLSAVDVDGKNIRVLKYVSKYVSKNCEYQRVIDYRINSIITEVAKHLSEEWLQSLECQLFKELLNRHIGQFHRQSTQFGVSFLRDVDLNKLLSENYDGKVQIVDNQRIQLRINLPMYYKRKLFYEQVELHGSKIWKPTEIGYKFLDNQRNRLHKSLKDRYHALLVQANLSLDKLDDLVDYLVVYRGRIKSDNVSSTFEQRIANVSCYSYVDRYSYKYLKIRGLYQKFMGNNVIGYRDGRFPCLPLSKFVNDYLYYDSELEHLISVVHDVGYKIDVGKQKAFELKERLTNLYHTLK